MWRLVAVSTLSTGLLWGTAEAKINWSFDQVIRKAEKRYGRQGQAKERLLSWSAMVEDYRGLSEAEKVEAVNRYFNRHVQFREDIALWKQADYWATPVETLVMGAGDCEDIALAKYFTLRLLDVAEEKLRITYARVLNPQQAHMVMTYLPEAGAEPMVLDNLTEDILPASARDDLQLLYAFDDRSMYAFDGRAMRRIGESQQIPCWHELLSRLSKDGFMPNQG
ncbi:transglutaminase-like cysteine peptidase [Pseudomonas zhanjiangensis]|uniref:Transglutaminase-like cysteine peptidase n=1 Tax=Pseudomonas zhanjiangensis TaxID=3239015 RepID=A0ABV3YWK2_9PSED